MTESFDPVDFFNQHVEGRSTGNVVSAPGPTAPYTNKKGKTVKPRTDISQGAQAQIAGAVRFLEHSIKLAGHQLSPEHHEAVREHAYNVLRKHFHPQSTSRANPFEFHVKAATSGHHSFTVTVGNADNKDHKDVHVASTGGHNFATDTKSMDKPTFGEFSAQAEPGKPGTYLGKIAEIPGLLKKLMLRVKSGKTEDIKFKNPNTSKRMMRYYEHSLKQKGNTSITLVHTTDAHKPWNSTVHHFGLDGETALSSHPHLHEMTRYQQRSAKPVAGTTAVSRRFVQSLTPAIFRHIKQSKTKSIGDLFSLK